MSRPLSVRAALSLFAGGNLIGFVVAALVWTAL